MSISGSVLTGKGHVLHLVSPGAKCCHKSATQVGRGSPSSGKRTLILQEGPEGHLLILIFGSCEPSAHCYQGATRCAEKAPEGGGGQVVIRMIAVGSQQAH